MVTSSLLSSSNVQAGQGRPNKLNRRRNVGEVEVGGHLVEMPD